MPRHYPEQARPEFDPGFPGGHISANGQWIVVLTGKVDGPLTYRLEGLMTHRVSAERHRMFWTADGRFLETRKPCGLDLVNAPTPAAREQAA